MVVVLTIIIVFFGLYAIYEPQLDIVKTKKKTLILLWYNKKTDTLRREYIKLFVL